MRKMRLKIMAAVCIITMPACFINKSSISAAEEIKYTEKESRIGDRVGEGDILSLPFWFPAGQIIRFYDENGVEMDSKFSMPGKDYIIPAYSEIWEKTKIPEGKAFDCWEVVKEPQLASFSFIWELKRVLKDSGENENPAPVRTEQPIPTQKPEGNQPEPTASPSPAPASKPNSTNVPAVTDKPAAAPKPAASVKPAIKPSPSPVAGTTPQAEWPQPIQSAVSIPGLSDELKPQEMVDITEAGIYLLEAGNTYTLKSRLADVNGDTCIYTEGIQFRVDQNGSFTFQQGLPE